MPSWTEPATVTIVRCSAPASTKGASFSATCSGVPAAVTCWNFSGGWLERLHPLTEQARARTVPVGAAEAAPWHSLPESATAPTPQLGRGVADAPTFHRNRASRAEDAEPAIAVRGGAPDGGGARTADDQRDPRVRRGQDAGVAEGEERSLVVDGLAVGQRAKYLERLVQPAASRRGIHARVRDLAAVFASDTDSEDQPCGRYLGDGRELSRRHRGVSQSGKVHTDEHLEGVVGGEDRRCRHQPVEARAALEADVVTGGDVV